MWFLDIFITRLSQAAAGRFANMQLEQVLEKIKFNNVALLPAI